jgi:hypothetical protein
VMGGVRPALVVEIMKQGREGPEIFVSAEFSRVSTRAGFDGQSVFAEALSLSVFTQKLPGIFTGWHGLLGKDNAAR